MLQLDLSTLSGTELRSLLDTARERGQAQQSYAILEEMARRREPGWQKPRKPRRAEPGEPRFIELELGDPLDHAEPLDEAEADPAAELRLDREPDPDPPPPRRWSAGVFTAGALLGVIIGAFAGSIGEAFLRPSSELAAFKQEVAATPPPPPVPAQPDAPLVAPAELADAAPPASPVEVAATEEPAAPVEEAEAVAPEDAVATEAPPPKQLAEAELEEPTPHHCAGAGTPADRAICGDAELEKLQRDLRKAYAAALDAHADRAVLRQRQLAWRDARSDVSDRRRLAALYGERIRKLNAATADARRQQ